MKRLAILIFVVAFAAGWGPVNLGGGVAGGGGTPVVDSWCTFTGTGTAATAQDYSTGGCTDPTSGDLVILMVGLDMGGTDPNTPTTGDHAVMAATDNANAESMTKENTGTRATELAGALYSYTQGSTTATTFTVSWATSVDWVITVLVFTSGSFNATSLSAGMFGSFANPDITMGAITNDGSDPLNVEWAVKDRSGSPTLDVDGCSTGYSAVVLEVGSGGISMGVCTASDSGSPDAMSGDSGNDGALSGLFEVNP